MEFSSSIIKNTVEQISKLPGIGKKSALRLVLFMLKNENSTYTKQLSNTLYNLCNEVKKCSECHNISDTAICNICSNTKRNKQILCVVENIQDVIFIENTSQFNGLYHVLDGLISPINGVGADKLNIDSLVSRIKKSEVKEVIFAFSATFDGDTTAFYINKLIKPLNVTSSILSRGMSVGSEIEYIDEITLGKSINSRIKFD
jgi:recombination protein RecR